MRGTTRCRATAENTTARQFKLSLVFASLICLFAVSPVFSASQSLHTMNMSYHPSYQMRDIGYVQPTMDEQHKQAQAAFDKGDYLLAKRIWRQLALQGHTESTYKLGIMYDMGVAAERDGTRAAYWYRKAAQEGHVHAQHNLAVAYASGDGVQLDIGTALVWWQEAARQGNSDSQYNLGIIYAMGYHGVSKNIKEAKKWWRQAAMNGDPLAQYNLGALYANGEGDVLSYCEAVRWWEKSAESGVKQAEWALEMIQTRNDYNSCW